MVRYIFYKKRKFIFFDLLNEGVLGKKVSNFYKIKLLRVGRKKKSFFKIVVVNWNNKNVDFLGYFNPHLLKDDIYFKDYIENMNIGKKAVLLSDRLIRKSDFFNNKMICLNYEKMFFWMSVGALFDSFIHKIIVTVILTSVNWKEMFDYYVEYAEGRNEIEIFNLIYSQIYFYSIWDETDEVLEYIKENFLGKERNLNEIFGEDEFNKKVYVEKFEEDRYMY